MLGFKGCFLSGVGWFLRLFFSFFDSCFFVIFSWVLSFLRVFSIFDGFLVVFPFRV